jgi:hypothetical protein
MILVLPVTYDTNRIFEQNPPALELVLAAVPSCPNWSYSSDISECEQQFVIRFETVISEEDAFQELFSQWKKQRGTTSSINDMILCPAYQKIIGMGSRAIPLILAQLTAEGGDPDHWFWALQVLTGTDPVSEEDEGDLRKMAHAWIEWAVSKGYAW